MCIIVYNKEKADVWIAEVKPTAPPNLLMREIRRLLAEGHCVMTAFDTEHILRQLNQSNSAEEFIDQLKEEAYDIYLTERK